MPHQTSLNPKGNLFSKFCNNWTSTMRIISFNTLASARIRGFSKKNAKTHVALHGNFSGPVYSTDQVKVSKDTASLLVWTWKKIFCLRMRAFCEWRHKWRTFRLPWPILPGPRHQLLSGSISLKLLLETRLQSESLDTLDDLLGFQVQKLWCKLVKIFD